MADAEQQHELDALRAPRVVTVSELTAEIKDLLEAGFGTVWVSGEVSNFSKPSSGHCYLTLKDEQAQIRAVIWRTCAQTLRFEIGDGLQVVCGGYLDVYGPRGTYQLVVQQILPKGIGPLELALRKLRERLAAEGFFDAARKRPLPKFPRRVALVTSPTGAAVRDFLEVLRRRSPAIHVTVVPVRVQGEGAAQEIAGAIDLLGRLRDPFDVVVVARGGGSLEDLWSFNEEVVVRAIYASKIPVISAVGHEIDVTLADLVADVRALTPSEAAELVAPARAELIDLLDGRRERLARALRSRWNTARMDVDRLAAARVFQRPLERVQRLAGCLDELEARAQRAVRHSLQRAQSSLAGRAAQLAALSPLTVLSRGYSVTRDEQSGSLITDAAKVEVGQRLVTLLARGEVTSRVEAIDAQGT